MAAINPITFGKNLRPATVEAIKKINEVVTAVNNLNATELDTLRADVGNLKTTVSKHTTEINAAKSSIDTINKTTQTHTTDIDKIKVTLYTPLAAEETTE